MTAWQLWLDHPEKSWVRNILFQVHFWVGAVASAYIFVMSVSGSLIVYRNELPRKVSVEWTTNASGGIAGVYSRQVPGSVQEGRH